jgi:hypothetical protein
VPPLEDDDLLQCAVFWPLLKVDAYANPILGQPVQLDVRWMDVQSIVMDPKGNTIGVDVTIVVNEDIEQFNDPRDPFYRTIIDGMITQNTLYGPTGVLTVTPTTGLYWIKTYNKTPDIKNRFNRRVVGAVRYTDLLPVVQ